MPFDAATLPQDLQSRVEKQFQQRPVREMRHSLSPATTWSFKPAATATNFWVDGTVSKVVRDIRDAPKVPASKLVPLAEWEGVVDAIDWEAGTFEGRLWDRASQDIPEERADFAIDDLSLDDAALLCEGAVFRWLIGKRESPHGSVERTSRIVFRRMPVFSQREIDRAAEESALIVARIPVE